MAVAMIDVCSLRKIADLHERILGAAEIVIIKGNRNGDEKKPPVWMVSTKDLQVKLGAFDTEEDAESAAIAARSVTDGICHRLNGNTISALEALLRDATK